MPLTTRADRSGVTGVDFHATASGLVKIGAGNASIALKTPRHLFTGGRPRLRLAAPRRGEPARRTLSAPRWRPPSVPLPVRPEAGVASHRRWFVARPQLYG